MRKREIAVVVVILAVGACLAAPCLIYRREQSRRDVCEFRQMFLAQGALRCDDLEGELPGYQNRQGVNFKGETVATGWAFRIMPYVGFDSQAEEAEFLQKAAAKSGVRTLGEYKQALQPYGESEDAAQQGDVPRFRMPALLCPADMNKHDQLAACSFVANCGMPDAVAENFPADWPANGVFFNTFEVDDPPHVSIADILLGDGADNTILFAENVDAGRWTDTSENLVGVLWATGGADSPAYMKSPVYRVNENRGQGDGGYRFARPSSFHSGGALVSFASGRTQFMNEDINPLVYAQLMAPDDQQAKYPGTKTPAAFASLTNSPKNAEADE